MGGPAPSALCDLRGLDALAGVLRSSSARSRSINGTERCKRRRAAIRAASSRAIRRCHRNETPYVVAVCVSNPDCSPLESSAETQHQLHPALLRLSAMISQYFTLIDRKP